MACLVETVETCIVLKMYQGWDQGLSEHSWLGVRVYGVGFRVGWYIRFTVWVKRLKLEGSGDQTKPCKPCRCLLLLIV